MDRGYVKLWRKITDSQIFRNEGLLKMWIWCLTKATHKKRWITVKTGRSETEVELLPGQFVFGRDSAAKELNMNPSTVWKRMQKLKKVQNLTIESNSNCSIVSIINWDTYQGDIPKGDSESDSRVTAEEQPSDTNKNVKNEKNFRYKLKVSIPSDIYLTDRMLGYAQEKGINNGSCPDIFEGFAIHHRKKGGKFVDWNAAWQTWVRNEIKYHPEKYETKTYVDI